MESRKIPPRHETNEKKYQGRYNVNMKADSFWMLNRDDPQWVHSRKRNERSFNSKTKRYYNDLKAEKEKSKCTGNVVSNLFVRKPYMKKIDLIFEISTKMLSNFEHFFENVVRKSVISKMSKFYAIWNREL